MKVPTPQDRAAEGPVYRGSLHTDTSGAMVQLLLHISRIILPVLVICFILPVSPGYAVPTLKDQSKQAVRKNISRPPAQTLPATAATLGRYRNISAVKRYKGSGSSRFGSYRAKINTVSARSIIIVDAVSGKTLFSRSPDAQRQPASTIKVLTGMIAMDTLKNSEQVSVSEKAARQPRSKVYLDHRRTYQANDLINAVLLASANDASVALAEKIAGSEKSFAKMMTERARRWGAKNTVCKTASGLTARGQKTTARDLATIFRQAMQDKEFASRMKRTKVRTTEGKLLRNHNKALWQVDGTQGGKTGYTNAARQTYVGKFKRGEDEIIVAIMGSESMWTDIKRLVSYGFSRKNQLAAETTPGKNEIKRRS